MRQTSNLGLALYDSEDKMNITGAENSLNHNMELIDEAIHNIPAGEPGQTGNDGITPHIGENGHWWIGEEDTGVIAEGQDGQDGALEPMENPPTPTHMTAVIPERRKNLPKSLRKNIQRALLVKWQKHCILS